MNHFGDAYKSLSDPLNEPPPRGKRVPSRLSGSGDSPLAQLLAELSAGPDKWRIDQMISDYNWLEEIAEERGISI